MKLQSIRRHLLEINKIMNRNLKILIFFYQRCLIPLSRRPNRRENGFFR
nr:MAG TPA: hypothetical protein [Caudoviricetes sp.]